MDTSFILLIIGALITGSFITWLLRKLVFEKNHIPASQFNELNDQFQLIKTDKALAEQETRNRLNELARSQQQFSATQSLADQLKDQVASAHATVEALSGEKERLLSETKSLQEMARQKLAEELGAAKKISELEVRLQNQTDLYQQQKADLEKMSDKLKADFSLLANAILDEKTQKFNDAQQKEMTTLLEPLKTNLAEFKKQVENTYKIENDERISLREQVKQMMGLNELLSKEARSLTMALSGSTKKQGDWGEMILETILDYCGLQKNIHYFAQESTEDEEGARIRPDILIKLSDNRVLIIDSKVSLRHYEQLCREENPDAQVILVKNMLQSLYSHIENLSSKKYTDVTDSLDMVIMFVPVEAAYITALQNDPGLQQFAYQKNVLLISPSNLTLAMKLVFDMWKRDEINKNAEAVAERAGRLYDKLALFVENFEKIGKAITGLQNTYGDAHKQLSGGKGNVISQAEQMKQLQIKSSKQMPVKSLSEATAMDPSAADEEPNQLPPSTLE